MTRYGEMLTCHDRAARIFTGRVPNPREYATEFLQRTIVEDARQSGDSSPVVHLVAERGYEALKRPSYQVDGKLCAALQETRLDLDPRHLQFPHAAFALELPLEGPGVIQDEGSGRCLMAILIASVTRRSRGQAVGYKCEIPVNESAWNTVIVQRWEEEDALDPAWFLIKQEDGFTVAEAVERACSRPFRETVYSEDDGGVRASQDTLRRMARLAIGASLFAVGANTKFCTRVPEPRAKRKRREKAQKKGQPVSLDDVEVQRWKLGHTINLPRGSQGRGGDGSEEGRELKFSHLRQGHLRMQRVGSKGEYKYVLRYIKPTIVRPDLGFPEGYRATKHRLDTRE